MVSDGFSVCVIQLLVAATPLILWLRVLSHDDHPVQNLVAQEHEKDSKLSSTLPHRCACCAKVLCSTLHSVVGVALPAAEHPQLPKLIALCFLAVRVLNFVVKRKRAPSEHSFSTLSVTRLHVIKTSWSAFGCCRRCGEIITFRLGLHQSLDVLCPLVLKRLLGQLDWFTHLRFCVASVLATTCNRLHSSISRSARPGTRHHSSRTYATRPVSSRPPKPSLSTRWTNREQSHQMNC